MTASPIATEIPPESPGDCMLDDMPARDREILMVWVCQNYRRIRYLGLPESTWEAHTRLRIPMSCALLAEAYGRVSVSRGEGEE